MVHVYHGDGKGKTTAALGLAVRMAGTGGRVYIVQFLKGQMTGEVRALLRIPEITMLRGKPQVKFVFQMTQEEKEEVSALHARQLELAFAAAERGDAQMIVLDEVLDAISTGTLSEEAVIAAVAAWGNRVEIVLTGRNPSSRILGCADYVTHMVKEKHPYDQGISARKGVEY